MTDSLQWCIKKAKVANKGTHPQKIVRIHGCTASVGILCQIDFNTTSTFKRKPLEAFCVGRGDANLNPQKMRKRKI
jgi:hypothetical protein